MDQHENGLPDEALAETDVLVWWGHVAHDQVADEVADRVRRHVLGGMGLVVLHSGHFSKVFRGLLGTTCSLRWRDSGDRELVWTVKPGHPVARGVPNPIVIPEQEMYGEFFDIPDPDELVFISSFSGGEVFRSGCAFYRGHGRIFYFSPGDQAYPVYHHRDVRTVIANAVAWAAPEPGARALPELRHSPLGWYTGEEGPMTGHAPLRAVLVGAGLMGRQWLEALRDHDDVELAGLADLDVRTAEEALAAVGCPPVPVAPDLEALADRVRPDFVVDVTIPEAHHAVTLGALRGDSRFSVRSRWPPTWPRLWSWSRPPRRTTGCSW